MRIQGTEVKGMVCPDCAGSVSWRGRAQYCDWDGYVHGVREVVTPNAELPHSLVEEWERKLALPDGGR